MIGIGISVAVYLLTQLYAECTLTEWSAWGPCTDFEVLKSLFVAASAGVVRAVAIAVHRSVLAVPVEDLSRVPLMLLNVSLCSPPFYHAASKASLPGCMFGQSAVSACRLVRRCQHEHSQYSCPLFVRLCDISQEKDKQSQ